MAKRGWVALVALASTLAMAQEVPPGGGSEWTLLIIEWGAMSVGLAKGPQPAAAANPPVNVVLTFPTRALCDAARDTYLFLGGGVTFPIGTGSLLEGNLTAVVMPCVQTK